VALAILALATAPLTLIVGIAASSAVLVAVSIADTVRQDDQAGKDNPSQLPHQAGKLRICLTATETPIFVRQIARIHMVTRQRRRKLAS
jgi:hypothetical protein